jgi:hypothetical protein
MTNNKSIENTSLPNSIIRTISEMYLSVLKDESSLGKKVADFVRVPKPGFWMIEKSSISGRRKEVGNSEAIVRFICFYQKNDEDIIYCTETIEGEFLTWGNCSFYCLLPYNFDWDSELELARTNLDWAKAAIARHDLEAELEPGERLFFEREDLQNNNTGY